MLLIEGLKVEVGGKTILNNVNMDIPDGETVYIDSALRHIEAVLRGEWEDAESGLPHYAHAVASLLISAALSRKEG